MAFKEVTQLRKSGKLEEALNMAFEDYNADTTNEWNIRSLAWVYYSMTRSAIENQEFEKVFKLFSKVVALEIPMDDTIFWSSYFSVIPGLIYVLQHQIAQNDTIIECLQPIKKMLLAIPIEDIEPEKYDKFITSINFLCKIEEQVGQLYEVIDWKHITKALFIKSRMKNGKMMPVSNGEKALLNYAKYMFVYGTQEQKTTCIETLEYWSHQSIDQTYLDYYAVKLHISMGHKGSEIITLLADFIKQKDQEFWVWQLLEEALPSEEYYQRVASLMRAASLRTQPTFLVKVHKQLGLLLMEKGYYADAKIELEKARKDYRDNVRRVDEITQILNEAPFKDRQLLKKRIDIDYMSITNRIVFTETEKITAIITYINRDRNILNFVCGYEQQSYTKVRDARPYNIGDIIELEIFNDYEKESIMKSLSIVKIDEAVTTDYMKSATGRIIIKNGKTFGFVDNMFINPQLVKQSMCIDGDEIDYTAVITYNKKKEMWNWSCVKVEKRY